MRQGGPGHRRQGIEERLEIEQIFDAHALVGGIGEGRVEVAAAGRDAELHGVDEIEVRPAADAIFRIGRDVGRVEGAELRLQRLTAAELQRLLSAGAGRGMAGFAAASPEHLGAIGEVGRVCRQRGGGESTRGRHDPEGGTAGPCQDHSQNQKLAQHQCFPRRRRVPGVLRKHGKPGASGQAAAALEPFQRRDHIAGRLDARVGVRFKGRFTERTIA